MALREQGNAASAACTTLLALSNRVRRLALAVAIMASSGVGAAVLHEQARPPGVKPSVRAVPDRLPGARTPHPRLWSAVRDEARFAQYRRFSPN